MQISVVFDSTHPYYLPQFIPVAEQLIENGHKTQFIVYGRECEYENITPLLRQRSIEIKYMETPADAAEYYLAQNPDWVIHGNPPKHIDKSKAISTKHALMMHGIGPKACYYEASKFPFDVRFVEGQKRLVQLKQKFPNQTFVDVGYAKLDPLFRGDFAHLSVQHYGLDPSKKTLLYAPTFYPSSIECFDESFPDLLASYNVIIKPHYFSYSKKRYAAQRQLFDRWAKYKNVYVAPVEEVSLLPFLSVADALIAEASSSMFEFITLDKPVIWCDFFHARWTYKGPFAFRLKKRSKQDMDLFGSISTQIKTPSELPLAVEKALQFDPKLSQTRKQFAADMAGVCDGKCSDRIVNYLTTLSA